MTKLLIYVAVLCLMIVPAFAAQHELMWDDGSHCGYYTGPNQYYATTFTAPYDLEIIAMKIFWYNCSSVHTCNLDIYSDSGGNPGSALFDAPVTGTIPVGG